MIGIYSPGYNWSGILITSVLIYPRRHGCGYSKLFGPVVQSVTSLIADQGVVSSFPAWSHTFMETDHEIFSMCADSR